MGRSPKLMWYLPHMWGRGIYPPACWVRAVIKWVSMGFYIRPPFSDLPCAFPKRTTELFFFLFFLNVSPCCFAFFPSKFEQIDNEAFSSHFSVAERKDNWYLLLDFDAFFDISKKRMIIKGFWVDLITIACLTFILRRIFFLRLSYLFVFLAPTPYSLPFPILVTYSSTWVRIRDIHMLRMNGQPVRNYFYYNVFYHPQQPFVNMVPFAALDAYDARRVWLCT